MPKEPEVDIEKILDKCRWMWTTQREEFHIVELKNSPIGYAVIRMYIAESGEKIVTPWGLSSDRAYIAVINRMIEEEIPIVTPSEMRRIQNQWLGRI